jgi:cytochrome c553
MMNLTTQSLRPLLITSLACLCLALPSFAAEKAEKKVAEETTPKYEVSIELGRVTYQHYCTPCHGVKGDGRGFNAPHLLVQPANHTDSKFMSERNDSKLFDTINLGGVEVAKSTLMPPWGAALGDERIKSIILHLRELCNCQATKSW